MDNVFSATRLVTRSLDFSAVHNLRAIQKGVRAKPRVAGRTPLSPFPFYRIPDRNMATSTEKWLTGPDGHEFYTKSWTPAPEVPVVAQVSFRIPLYSLSSSVASYTLFSTWSVTLGEISKRKGGMSESGRSGQRRLATRRRGEPTSPQSISVDTRSEGYVRPAILTGLCVRA